MRGACFANREEQAMTETLSIRIDSETKKRLISCPGHNAINSDLSDNYERNQNVLVIADEQRSELSKWAQYDAGAQGAKNWNCLYSPWLPTKRSTPFRGPLGAAS